MYNKYIVNLYKLKNCPIKAILFGSIVQNVQYKEQHLHRFD